MTTGRLKRTIKRKIIPFYGKKGVGFINNPKKAIYNKIYQKTTVASPLPYFSPSSINGANHSSKGVNIMEDPSNQKISFFKKHKKGILWFIAGWFGFSLLYSAISNNNQTQTQTTNNIVESTKEEKEPVVESKQNSEDKSPKSAPEEDLEPEPEPEPIIEPAPSAEEPKKSNYSPNSGVTTVVEGYCNDGTYVKGNPSLRGGANACYGHGGWRDY